MSDKTLTPENVADNWLTLEDGSGHLADEIKLYGCQCASEAHKQLKDIAGALGPVSDPDEVKPTDATRIIILKMYLKSAKERNQRLRAVAEAAKEFRTAWCGGIDKTEREALAELGTALDALDRARG